MIENLELALPEHTHAAQLHSHDPATRLPVARIVVWTDRARASCEDCLAALARSPACPVTLNGRQLQEWSQQCGCGTWHAVRWDVVPSEPEDITREQASVVAETLRAEFDQEVHDERAAVRARLIRELREAQAAWEAPLAPGETFEQRERALTGGELVDDGSICLELDDGEWVAIALDPTQSAGSPNAPAPEDIVVRARELAVPTASR